MVWALVSSAGFVVTTALVIALARGRTAAWERQKRLDDDADLVVRRGRPRG